MKRAVLIHFAGFAALGFASAAAADSVPGHAMVSTYVGCSGVRPEAICRIDVPNGDFAGGPNDTYSHAGLLPAFGPSHSIAQHIAPWRYLDGSGYGFARETSTDEPFVLRMPGDSIEQRIPLPAHVSENGVVVSYTVHAHVGSYSGASRVRLAAHLLENGHTVAGATRWIEVTDTRGFARVELVVGVDVPADRSPDSLSITLASEPGEGRVPLADVFILRAPVNTYLPALTPTW